MNLIIKHSIKNIFAKPLRLLLLVFCITFASFTALLALDMKHNIQSLMRGYAMEMLGKADIIAYNTTSDILEGIDDIAQIKKIGIGSTGQFEYERDTTGYEYSFEKRIDVVSLSDMDMAVDMAFIPESFELDDESVVVNKEYADTFGVSAGDTVEFETRDEVKLQLKVIGVIDIKNSILKGRTAIVTNENVRRINCTQDDEYQIWMIDVLDDAKISAVADALRSNDPRVELENITEAMDDPDIQQIYDVFYLLFLISFLLVIFVTTSIAEKIVNERMSVIGTLRSLGVTQGKTAFVLLIENIIYALIGSCIGIILYSWIKPIFLGNMFNMEAGGTSVDFTKYFGPTPIYVLLIVIAGAILVECAYPLYELSKAVKTPIRDIIFDNKDTEFKYRWGRLYTGIVLAVVAIVAGLMVKNFLTLAVSLACGVVALAVLIPFLIRIFSKGLTAAFRKISLPVAQLAAENISRNRIIMGTAVLCVTSITLSLLIGGLGEALANDLTSVNYDCDVIVDIYISDNEHNYRYISAIEGVEEMDHIFTSYSFGTICDDKGKTISVFADSPHTMIKGLPENGYALEEGEAVISKIKAEKLKLKAGDEIKLVLNPDTDFPTEKTFIIKDILDTDKLPVYSIESIIINKDLYDHLFAGRLAKILIKTADPDKVKTSIEKYSETQSLRVTTIEEYRQEDEQSSKGLLGVMRFIIAGSVALTLIGVAGNQSLGFITRKRETALLYSVALPRHKLKRLIFLESLFSMGISALVAAITAPFLYKVLANLLDGITDGDTNILSGGGLGTADMLVYLAIILVVYLLTTLIPSRYLRKMKIAEELKYE